MIKLALCVLLLVSAAQAREFVVSRTGVPPDVVTAATSMGRYTATCTKNAVTYYPATGRREPEVEWLCYLDGPRGPHTAFLWHNSEDSTKEHSIRCAPGERDVFLRCRENEVAETLEQVIRREGAHESPRRDGNASRKSDDHAPEEKDVFTEDDPGIYYEDDDCCETVGACLVGVCVGFTEDTSRSLYDKHEPADANSQSTKLQPPDVREEHIERTKESASEDAGSKTPHCRPSMGECDLPDSWTKNESAPPVEDHIRELPEQPDTRLLGRRFLAACICILTLASIAVWLEGIAKAHCEKQQQRAEWQRRAESGSALGRCVATNDLDGTRTRLAEGAIFDLLHLDAALRLERWAILEAVFARQETDAPDNVTNRLRRGQKDALFSERYVRFVSTNWQALTDLGFCLPPETPDNFK